MRAVLTYHSIDRSGSVISVTPEAFRRHVRALSERGVRMTTLSGLLALPPHMEAVAITFDDGFATVEEEARAVLQDYGAVATVFVVTDRVGGDSGWAQGPGPQVPARPLLDWDALARLQEAGFEIGSHTRTHADLRTLSPSAVQDEVGESAAIIQRRTGRQPVSFAYPFGEFAPSVEDAVRAAYRFACTTRLGFLESGAAPHRLPRLDAYYFRHPGALDAWAAPGFRRYIRFRAAGRQLRRMMRRALAGAA